MFCFVVVLVLVSGFCQSLVLFEDGNRGHLSFGCLEEGIVDDLECWEMGVYQNAVVLVSCVFEGKEKMEAFVGGCAIYDELGEFTP